MLNQNDDYRLREIVENICERMKAKYPYLTVGYYKNDDGIYRIFHNQYDLEYQDKEFDSFINSFYRDLLGGKYAAYVYVVYDSNTKDLITYNAVDATEICCEYENISVKIMTQYETSNYEEGIPQEIVEILKSNTPGDVLNILEAA